MNGKSTFLAAFVLTFALVFCWISPALGQDNSQEVTFSKSVGLENSAGYSVYPTTDSGYVLAGSNGTLEANGTWTFVPLIVKADSNGDVEWTRTYESYASSIIDYSVVQTPDSGYALFHGARIVKIDMDGNAVWNKSLPLNAAKGILTSNDELVIVGNEENIEGQTASVVKTDVEGNQIWSINFSESAREITVRDVVEAEDGGFVLTGNWGNKCWLAKTSANGNLLTNRTYDIESGQWPYLAYAVAESADGGFMVAANSANVPWLTKVNATDEVEFTQLIYWTGLFEAMVSTEDGNFFVVGNQLGNAWIIRTNQAGGSVWEATYGQSAIASNPNTLKDIVKTRDGGYVAVGAVNNAMWILKLAPEPASTPTPTSTSSSSPTAAATSNPPGATATPGNDQGIPEIVIRILIIVIIAAVIGVVFLIRSRRRPSVQPTTVAGMHKPSLMS